jgi:hypothetical protein
MLDYRKGKSFGSPFKIVLHSTLDFRAQDTGEIKACRSAFSAGPDGKVTPLTFIPRSAFRIFCTPFSASLATGKPMRWLE